MSKPFLVVATVTWTLGVTLIALAVTDRRTETAAKFVGPAGIPCSLMRGGKGTGGGGDAGDAMICGGPGDTVGLGFQSALIVGDGRTAGNVDSMHNGVAVIRWCSKDRCYRLICTSGQECAMGIE